MNSLRFRLFAAFLFIILIVTLVTGFALILLLRNTPLVERQTLTRLNEAARAALRSSPPLSDQPPEAAAQYVKQLADTFEVRVLIVEQDGSLLADSSPTPAPLTLNFRTAREDPAAPGSRNGRGRDAARRIWLYVARPIGQKQLLVFALEQDRFPALTFFFENLFPPLAEAGAVAACLAIVLAVLIARSIALPLQKMAVVAQGIARGDYAQTAPVSGPDEVRDLGQSLNQMAFQVQVTQQAQRDFLANVSHELKTPLTSIQGFAQALLDGAADSPQAIQRSANIIYTEADRLRRLVEGLLDLARLDAGLRALTRAPFDLRLVLATVVEKFSLRAKEKGITLRGDLPPALPAMVGDADRLAQVFTNLLDNALKHTPAGGSVTLSAASIPGGVEVTVKDTGPGIPPQDLQRIFERFYQVDKSRARPSGVGLGLTITKEIVEAHNGNIRVESTPGVGTQFIVRLPPAQSDDTTVIKRRGRTPVVGEGSTVTRRRN
jgi:two-component system OmpR family sensor kinase